MRLRSSRRRWASADTLVRTSRLPVSTSTRRPDSASSISIQPASGSWCSRGSSTVIATTSWRAASRRRGRSHPSAMKSDSTTTIL